MNMNEHLVHKNVVAGVSVSRKIYKSAKGWCIMSAKKQMSSIMPAMLTPLNKDGSFDKEGMKNLVQYMWDSGIRTFVPLGYTGEGRAFRDEERSEIIKTVRECLPEDSLLIAGAMGDSTRLILDRIDSAKEAGADMVLVTPSDFFWLTDAELENLFIDLDKNTSLPIMIYNCNENHHFIAPDMMARLANCKNLVALKQSTDLMPLNDMKYALDQAQPDDFTLVSGNEFILYPALAMGFEKFIMGGPGNISPGLCVDICESYFAGDTEKSKELFVRHLDFYRELYFNFPQYPMAMPQMKAAMEILGVCKRWVHAPAASCTDADVLEVEKLMKKYKIGL